MRGLNTLWSVLAAGLLSGCTYVVKDTAVICEADDAAPLQVMLPAVAGQPARTIALELAYERVDAPPGQDDNAVWLSLSAANAGRRRYEPRLQTPHGPVQWGPGEAPIPLWYSTAGAQVVREDGQPIAADPALFRGFGVGPGARGRRAIRFDTREIDLNSDAIRGPRPLADLNLAIMIRFDIPPPAPDARWTFHPGQLRVGDTGVVVDLPARALCLRKGHRGKVHWSMLP